MTTELLLENTSLSTAAAEQVDGSGARMAPFTSLTTTTDPVTGFVDTIIYSGFRTTLSAVIAGLAGKSVNSLYIFADTLEVDVPTINTSGLIIMARAIDVSALGGQPLVIDPGAGREAAAQFLLGAGTGGSFSVATAAQPAASITVSAGLTPLNAAAYVAVVNGAWTAIPSSGDAVVQDLVSRTWPYNSLQSSYAGATWLMNDDSTAARTTAQQMLTWIVACTSSVAAADGSLPGTYGELYSQAAALLVTLNVAAGTAFVPVLSGQYYSAETTQLLTVLRDYEANMATLNTATDVAAAVAAVSAGLKGSAGDEIAPLNVQLTNISNNLKSLYSEISDLRGNFDRQVTTAEAAFSAMSTAFTLEHIKQQLSAELHTAVSAIMLGFDAAKLSEGDPEGLKSGIEDSVKGMENVIDLIDSASEDGTGDDLTQTAVDLLQAQQTLMGTLLNGQLLWQQAVAGRSGGLLPSTLGAATVDPVTTWNNYSIAAKATIDALEADNNIDISEAKAKADLYVASLEILAGYGKAISGKFAAYVAQLVQATVITAQINAAQSVEARWAAIEAQADSGAEKLAVLKALVQARADAIKRSIYVAWTYYAAAYYYLNFNSPPNVLHLDMTAAQLEDALSGVAQWVTSALLETPDGTHVMLPSDQTSLELDFAIVTQQTAGIESDVAWLAPLANGGWSLTWAVPLGTEQLQGVLPNEGQCAIWISNATFLLDGVTPNSKGNVIASVATSGTYQNGFGPQNGHTFVTKGLIGNYMYTVANESVYGPWSIDTAVYMTPTPYTLWTMTVPPDDADLRTATRLHMKLTVSYMTRP